ncbi:hypothetical protein [Paracoccus yeei]|uniref:hypothetical protein n=1 Tax=Paracoccus yeei TaxID=147645 RepID=UPI00049069E6|nr:hypothetical protein [Paracoccus yeei]OWJ96017.1 hypothetical protein CDV54_07315 [Paracoccus yeei]
MAKKGGFSFDGMVDPDASPAEPIEGVKQRGAGGKKPTPVAKPVQRARRGRPAKPRTATEARPSFGLDPETHALFKIWLLRRGLSMQDYLEGHIRDLVQGDKL